MNKKRINIFTTIIIVIFAGALLFLTTSLLSSYQKAPKKIYSEFTDLTNTISELCRDFSIDSESFYSNFENTISQYDDLSSVKLYNGNKLIYSWKNYDNTIRHPDFIQSYSETVFNTTDSKIFLKVQFNLLSKPIIFNSVKISFFIVVIGLFITALVIIFISTEDETTKADKEQQTQEEYISSTDEESLNDDLTTENFPDLNFTEFDLSNTNNRTEDSDILNTNEQNTPSSSSEENDSEEEISQTEEVPKEEEISTEKDNLLVETVIEDTAENNSVNTNNYLKTYLQKQNNDSLHLKQDSSSETSEEEKEVLSEDCASDLTTPDSLISEESKLIPHLDNELIRAASSENDLSLFVFTLETIDYDSEVTQKIITEILTEFHFKDMIFKYQNNSIAAIIQDMDIDKAYEIAERLYIKLTDIVNTNIAIGISSRSIRLISAERLLNEAHNATLHCDSNSHIVAFRVDPEKYRKYIAAIKE